MNLFNNLQDWGKVTGPFQFSNLPHLLKSQLFQNSSDSFFFFEKVNKEQLKMVHVNY